MAGDVYTARNTPRRLQHHQGVPERYREGYVPPKPADRAKQLRDARNERLKARLDQHYAAMGSDDPRRRTCSLLLQHLFSIREAENMEALQRRYLSMLDKIELAMVAGGIDLAWTDRAQKLALNASNKRAEELVPCR